MRATKEWGPCSCECGKTIKPGDEMVMFEGAMYLAGHEKERRTRTMVAIKKEVAPEKRRKGARETQP